MPGSKRAKSLWLSGFDLILLFLKIIVYEKLIVISEEYQMHLFNAIIKFY